MLLVENIVTKKGDKIGDRKIKAITPVSADKIYEIILAGPSGKRPRQAEKVVVLCRRAWDVVHRLYPDEFDRDVPNPWDGVTMQRRVKAKKPAVTRDHVYTFALGAVEQGTTGSRCGGGYLLRVAAAPRKRAGGVLRWPDYRSKEWPSAIKILHHKTGDRLAPTRGDSGRRRSEVLPGGRSNFGETSSSRRSYDLCARLKHEMASLSNRSSTAGLRNHSAVAKRDHGSPVFLRSML